MVVVGRRPSDFAGNTVLEAVKAATFGSASTQKQGDLVRTQNSIHSHHARKATLGFR